MPANTDLLNIPRSRNLDMDYDANARIYRAVLDELYRLQTAVSKVNDSAVPSKISNAEAAAFTTNKGNLLTAITTALGHAQLISTQLSS